MSLGKEIHESLIAEPNRWRRSCMTLERDDGVNLFFCDIRFFRAITMQMDKPQYINLAWRWKLKIARAMKTLNERQTLQGVIAWRELEE